MIDAAPSAADTAADELPVLTDSAVARIEAAVLHEISGEGRRETRTESRARVRRRRWLTGAGIAAAFVVGILVTPPIISAVDGGAMSTADSVDDPPGLVLEDSRGGSFDQSAPGVAADSPESSTLVPGAADTADREIVATAAATVEVEDVAAASTTISALAESYGGYVESTEIGMSTAGDSASAPVPTDAGYGWISIRVPSSDLTAVIAALADSGDVLSSSVSRQDVTSTAIDLRARIDATQASVQRLTELMSQTGTVAELIEAEVALTDRQAQLESYQQQLSTLDDQVALSTLQVQLTRTEAPTAADPAGFTDGLFAGWNGLVASLNALVVALGFLLPWIAIGGVIVLAVVIARRAQRSRRSRRSRRAPTTES
nr:DUF4349 domain-containing protein [Microbacterium hydrocarbonoxydans]